MQMNGVAPTASVLAAFGRSGDAEPLPGGEGSSWRVGDLVLKPDVDEAEWSWVGERIASIAVEGLRLAAPVRASDGAWTVAGWGATPFLEGAHADRWLDVLTVGDAFHAAIREFERPSFLDDRTHPWAVGDQVAWQEVPWPVSSPLLDELVSLGRPVRSPSQVIHGDLTENVLFADRQPPAVIDFSPYYRPAGYANAIVIGDAVRWRGADPAPLLDAARHHTELPQLLIRASYSDSSWLCSLTLPGTRSSSPI